MSLIHDVSAALGSADEPSVFAQLVDNKSTLHLGISGQEFCRRWYRGAYRDDPRPVVHALNELMRTGMWRAPIAEAVSTARSTL